MGQNNLTHASKRGFTYLEMLIVILVITVLTIGGNVAYVNFNQRKQLASETKKVVSYFDLAQRQAISGEKPCETYQGVFSVNLGQPGTQVVLDIHPRGCVDAQATYTLPVGYSLPEGNFSLGYEQFGTHVSGSSCLIILQTQTGQCGKLTFEASGNLKDEQLSGASCICP